MMSHIKLFFLTALALPLSCSLEKNSSKIDKISRVQGADQYAIEADGTGNPDGNKNPMGTHGGVADKSFVLKQDCLGTIHGPASTYLRVSEMQMKEKFPLDFVDKINMLKNGKAFVELNLGLCKFIEKCPSNSAVNVYSEVASSSSLEKTCKF